MKFNLLLIAAVGIGMNAMPVSAQLLETETAHLVPARHWEIGGNFEQQWSGEGSETAIPFAIEYGFSRRFELLVEPVAYTRIHPKRRVGASGVGDLELTGTYLLHPETAGTPGIALAAEVKLPTAKNSQIGTQKADFAGYLIMSRHMGQWDLHANLDYTRPGNPTGVKLRGIFGAALAVEHALGTRTEVFAEVLGNTSASTVENPEGSATPEIAGGELVGTVGLAHQIVTGLQLALSLSYDNNNAVLLRPGFVLRF